PAPFNLGPPSPWTDGTRAASRMPFEEVQVMANDMVVALGQAAVNGTTLFASNAFARPSERFRLCLSARRDHPLDETLPLACVKKVPQVRETHTVLGCQVGAGWGFTHGVNEHHVALGVTDWRSRFPAADQGLTGPELVRLTLERSHSAVQAVDVMTD